MQETQSNRILTGWRFGLLCALQIWVAHGIAFLVHEYAHAFTATVLGLKSNPWMLHFGTPGVANRTMQWQINSNVDYATIYAHGHGQLAALIAFAGFGIGLFVDSPVSNGMTWASWFIGACGIAYVLYKQSAQGDSRSAHAG